MYVHALCMCSLRACGVVDIPSCQNRAFLLTKIKTHIQGVCRNLLKYFCMFFPTWSLVVLKQKATLIKCWNSQHYNASTVWLPFECINLRQISLQMGNDLCFRVIYVEFAMQKFIFTTRVFCRKTQFLLVCSESTFDIFPNIFTCT